jgi:quinol monooxygenase YgiN
VNNIHKLVALLTIRIIAKFHVQPEKAQEFLGLCKKIIDETIKEDGCIEYGLYQDLQNPEILTFLEEWRDESSIDEHMKSKHFTEIFPLFSECLVKEAEVGLYKKKL